METISNLMSHPIVCTKDTRIAEIKHLLKKYDYDEILVVDSNYLMHPIGLLGPNDVENDEINNLSVPSNRSAEECMRKIEAVVLENSSIDECLNVLRGNDIDSLPVVDLSGHLKGVIYKKDLEEQLISRFLH